MKDIICKNKTNLFYIIGFIILIFGWGVSSICINNPIILPKISDTMVSLFQIITKFENIIIIIGTLGRLMISVLIGFFISIIIIILYLLYPPILGLFKPLLAISKSTPVASIIIIALIWVGSIWSPILIATLVVFPLMLEAMIAGVKSIDKSYIEELELNGGITIYTIKSVLIPFTYPYIFLGIIQSVGLGLKVVVMSELISQTQNSIGNALYINKVYFHMSGLFAWTIILIGLVILIEYLIGKAKMKIVQTK